MISLAPRAERQLERLRRHYVKIERTEALRNLIAAVLEAADRIERNPAAGLLAPRPYPSMTKPDRLWVKAGRYWVSYATTDPPIITSIFYDAADIPGRI